MNRLNSLRKYVLRGGVALAAWLVLSVYGLAATGDLTPVVNADGETVDIVASGFTTGGTYAFGFSAVGMPGANTPYLTVTTSGYDSLKNVTAPTRTIYITKVTRVPWSTATIVGTYVSGTFVTGETVTQGTSGATGIVYGIGQTAGTKLRIYGVTGSPDNSHDWTGGTSGAVFTASATPVTLTGVGTYVNDELYNGTDLRLRCYLSSRIRSGDTVTATIPAAFVTNTGGASQTSNALSAVSITNNSTESHTPCFSQWAIDPWEKWQANPYVAVTARHLYGVAAVDVLTSDTHGNTVTTALARQTKLRPASSIYVEEWGGTVDLSTLTQGDVLTTRHIVYPSIGGSGAVFDTNAITVNVDNTTLGRCNFTYMCDKNASMDVFAVVDLVNGNNGTAVSSATLATAAASPYLTIAAAATAATPNIIYIRAGTGNVVGGTVTAPASKGYWRQVKVYPGDGAVVLQLDGTKTYNVPHWSYEGVTIQSTAGSNRWFDGANSTRYIRFKSCTFDDNAVASNGTVSAFGYRSACCFLRDNTFNDASKWGLHSLFVARVCHWFDGNYMPSLSIATIQSGYRWAGNRCYKVGSKPNDGIANTAAPVCDPVFYEFNKFMGGDTSAGQVIIGINESVTASSLGISFVGNIVETIAGTNPAVQISSDGGTGTVAQVIVVHNSIAGYRFNFLYNNAGTAAISKKNVACHFNAFGTTADVGGYNIKSDYFGTQNGNRRGNWGPLHGVDYIGNCQAKSGGFNNAYPGLGSLLTMDGVSEGNSNATICTFNWVSDKSNSGTSAGNGDYTPGVSSALLNKVYSSHAGIHALWDIAGTAILTGGTGSAGAIQLIPAGGGSTRKKARTSLGLELAL